MLMSITRVMKHLQFDSNFIVDNEGMTPILLASLMGHVDIVSYFHHLSPQLVLIQSSPKYH